MNILKTRWEKCDWPFDSDHAKKVKGRVWRVPIGQTWQSKSKRCNWVYLQDVEHFPFTVACGPNSSRSYSGCFFGHPKIKTLADAKEALSKREF
jgi:hypothetical protein